MKLFILLLVLVAVVNSIIQDDNNIKINPSTHMFIDKQRRTRLFHGVNAVYKLAPYYPDSTKFDAMNSLGVQDAINLKQWGLVVIVVIILQFLRIKIVHMNGFVRKLTKKLYLCFKCLSLPIFVCLSFAYLCLFIFAYLCLFIFAYLCLFMYWFVWYVKIIIINIFDSNQCQ
jgi:hypothetical protein